MDVSLSEERKKAPAWDGTMEDHPAGCGQPQQDAEGCHDGYGLLEGRCADQ